MLVKRFLRFYTIDFLQGRPERVILAVLPRRRSQVDEHADLATMPDLLLRRRPGQFLGRRLGDDTESDGEKTN